MGRPPSNGGPAFRFTQPEVTEMEAILSEHNNAMPARDVLQALADKFSESPDRKGKITVQMKQVWNWFQNKRYAIRAKSSKTPAKLNITPMPRTDLTPGRIMTQPTASPVPAPSASVQTTAKAAPENSVMEFEAKSGRDGAWYDVATFLSYRHLESSDPEVLVRFAGFGSEEDEWINVRKNVRPRSLPCESSECVAVLPGDLILCFQEGKEQALYFDAHVLDAQRRRHDVRGCRCRFLVRYDHDQSEEIVPLRKICRRPETDYRLHQLHAVNDAAPTDQQKVDRRIDLSSQIVRTTTTLKVENAGSDVVSEILLTFPDNHVKHLAYMSATLNEGKGKAKSSSGVGLPYEVARPKDIPSSLATYSVTLPKGLGKGESLTLDILTVFTHILQPFPEKITQADIQLLLFQESAQYLSPYPVKVQSLNVKLPEARIESYTKLENTKLQGSELKYGPYENLPPFSYLPIVIHFENNQPFAVAKELVREIEISHWGNVQITEHYNLVHGGAQSKGEFSRLDYQARPYVRGASAFRRLTAKLPPRAHSVYYRDEIGNISTSSLWGDSKKTELEIEPRYPLFGGWKTAFTIGYGLPLQDFLFGVDGKRFLNISFGSPINDLVIDTLVVKVVLPEGSKDISPSVPFPVKERHETKFSHLDIAGRPVVVLEKNNAVPEHNEHFQVYYKFNRLSMLREPLMLISGFFFLFLASIVYMHADLSISKTSASYLAKIQWEEVQATIHQVHSIISRCLTTHDKLEASLRDLSRTGDIQGCKATRKSVDSSLKELTKELKSPVTFLQSSPQAAQILPKVEEVIAKERDLQEKLMAKHSTVVDCYEKKLGGREIENRIASHQQKITSLKQEIYDLMDLIDEI